MKKLSVLISLLIFAQTSLADKNSEFVSAASEGRVASLKALVSESDDVLSDSRLALISASFAALERQGKGESFADQIEVVQVLVEAGSEVDEHFDNGFTALMLMAILGETDVVHQLIDAGADVNTIAAADGSTPLIFAVYGGKTEIVSALVDAGADASVADAGSGESEGRTALSYAIEKDHSQIVEVLKLAEANLP